MASSVASAITQANNEFNAVVGKQNSTTWQDFNQHNSRQEEDARREELARLKNLASVRNSSSNGQISTLEQPVHSLGNTARYATSNLNVVA